MDANSLFRQGVEAVKAKKLDEGKKLLHTFLKQNPDDATAWLWYSQTFNDPEIQKKIVDRALSIDPNHPQALKVRQRLEHQKPAQTSAKQAPRKTASPSDYGEFSVFSLYQFVGIAWSLFLLFMIVLIVYFGFAPIEDGSLIFAFVAFVTMLGCAIWMMRVTNTALNRKVTIYDKGIKISDISDNIFEWKDIIAIRFADRQVRTRLLARLTPIIFVANTRVTIRLNERKTVRISQIFTKYDELQQLIFSLSTPEMIARDNALIENGETVSYGKILADKQGLHKGNETIAWDEVVEFKEAGILLGRVTVVGVNKVKIHHKVRNVWNIHLLPHLIASRQK